MKVPARVSLWIVENTRLQDCADDNANTYDDAGKKETEAPERGRRPVEVWEAGIQVCG